MTETSLLTAVNCTGHVHLIIGSNPLAAARCSKSLEVGAKPLLIAPADAELHYALQQKIESGEVHWLKKLFEAQDVLQLGREEVGGVVDAVFLTSRSRNQQQGMRFLFVSVSQCSSAGTNSMLHF